MTVCKYVRVPSNSLIGDHVADQANFGVGELGRRGPGEARAILERAGLGQVAPSVEAGRGQDETTKSDRGGHGLLGGCNGAQNHVLGGQAMEVEVEAGEPHEQEVQADDGK
jgi:hypothetical protein